MAYKCLQAADYSISYKNFELEENIALPTIPPWEVKRFVPTKSYLHGKPLPGRRHPVKAASREAGARNAPALTG